MNDRQGENHEEDCLRSYSERIAACQLSRIRAASQDLQGSADLLPVAIAKRRLNPSGDPHLDEMARKVFGV